MTEGGRVYRVLLVGIGSPFGADRLGWQAVSALQSRLSAAAFPCFSFRFEQSDRPGSGLLNLLRECDVALLFDAMISGAEPGSVRRFAVDELASCSGFLSSHGFGVADALALGRQLQLLPPTLLVYGIEADPALQWTELPSRSLASLVQLVLNDLTDLRR